MYSCDICKTWIQHLCDWLWFSLPGKTFLDPKKSLNVNWDPSNSEIIDVGDEAYLTCTIVYCPHKRQENSLIIYVFDIKKFI